MTLKVLYEDNHLIAVYKPAGVLVQGDATGDQSLMDVVRGYLKEKYAKKGNVFLGLLHRLDRGVEGIVLFAKTSKGASRLSEQFRNHEVKKTYEALVEGKVKKTRDTLVNFLIKDEQKNVVQVFDQDVPDSLRAELDYEKIKEVEGNTLLKINLKTGRPHQIRSQLSHIGHPIVGDKKYGAKETWRTGVIALAAVNLEFETATTKERKNLSFNPAWH
ncbi:MAG TPA: RNA pseudouridine synthase [Patescibacteria group bacterium]|nr:RNA pseudouridine synthase [Patescibacteria group bacterium]